MIKLGTKTMNIQGIGKVYRGNTLIYEKGNPAPADTKVLMHFDNDYINAVTNTTPSQTQASGNSFGQGKFNLAVFGSPYFYETPDYVTSWLNQNALTFEFWIKRISGNATSIANFCTKGNSYALFNSTNAIAGNGLPLNSGQYQLFSSSTIVDTLTNFDITNWNHIAVTIYQGAVKVYVNGTLATTGQVRSSGDSYGITQIHLNTSGFAIDEFMLCESIKYNADFTPPTKPYTL